MGHEGHHHGTNDTARLKLALGITAALMVAEVIGGLVSNSIALLADAGHMLTDVAALGLALFVAWFARLPRASRREHGYLRWETTAALINGVTLLLVSAWITWESLARFREPEPVTGGMMLGVAVLGLIANVAAARVLHPASRSSLNVRGAYLHVLGDLFASVGTVAAAVVIWATGWLPADPLASLFTTALIVRGALILVRDSVSLLRESGRS